MRTVVFLDALHKSTYATENLYNNTSCIDLVKDHIHRLDLPVYVRGELPWDNESHFENTQINGTLLKDVLKSLSTLEADKIIVMNVNNPFLVFPWLRELRKLAEGIIGEYVFADGFPGGLIPRVIDRRIIASLAELADEKTLFSQANLHELIMKHVNAFDVNTYLSKTDHRLLRLDFNCMSRDGYMLCKSFAPEMLKEEPDLDYVLTHDAEKLRILPKYFPIQLTTQFEQQLRYLPKSWYKQDIQHMPLENVKNLVKQIHELSDEAVLNLSYLGDCLLHPQIEDILEYILQFNSLKVFIETAGLAIYDTIFAVLKKFAPENLYLVFCIDSVDRSIYESLRGNGYDEALENLEKAFIELPESTHVQAVRTKVSDKGLEQFYRYFKEKTEHIIIQKYNYFSGRLDQRKLVDLSPVKRFPCWHLKREFAVLVDGRVPKCADDYDCEDLLGNVFADSSEASPMLENIWRKGQALYTQHLKGEYCGLCRECDEYYTFNF